MDKLSKSSREIYDRAMNFLTSDYAKVLGKNAIIGILSLILIGGASVAGAKGIENLQLNLDKKIINKSLPSLMADIALTTEDGEALSAKEKKTVLKEMSMNLIDLLSKLGGEHTKDKYKTTTASGLSNIKGKGWAADFKKKFNEVKKKVYKELTSEEAQFIGATALTAIILGIMGYGTGKAVQYRNSLKKSNIPVIPPVIEKTNTELIDEAISTGDTEKILAALAKSIKEGEGATTKTLKQLQDTEYEKTILDMISKKAVIPATNQDILEAERDLYDQGNNPTGIVFKKRDPGFDSSDEDEQYDPPTNQTKPPHMKGPGLKGGKLTSVTTEDIKNYIHKVVTSKEAKGLGIAALTSLIMAGLGIAGYKAHQYARERRNPDVTDSDFIKSQRNNAKLKAKEKDVIPIKKSIVDTKSQKIDELEDELDRQDALNIKLSPLYVQKDAMRSNQKKISPIIKSIDPNYDPNNDSSSDDEAQKNRYKLHLEKKAEDDARLKVGIVLDDIIHKVVYNDNSDKALAKVLSKNLVDSAIDTDLARVTGKGLKGRGFSDNAKKVKDKIYKIITSPNAKTMGIAALSTLIITALGGVGFHMIKSHDDKVRSIEQGALKKSRDRNFIKDIESAWKPEYKEGERATHFSSGMGLNADSDKRLKTASKKITDLIQYARDLHLDKAALVSLITFLLGGAGYAGFRYIKGKARESEPIGYIPTDEVRDALEEFATGKHRMGMSENIKADTKNANMPWIDSLGFGLKNHFLKKADPKHFLKGGDLSKFGEYAKNKEEAEKKAKPFAEKITDWIYSDEAKLIGKAGIQYSILAALGLLTAYAGKKAGEKAISLYPEDKSKINDPTILDPALETSKTGDRADVQKALRQYGKEEDIRRGFRPDVSDKGELNLKRYLLENPKSAPAQKYLKETLKIEKPYDKSILQSDPLLATIFRDKMKSKAPLQMVDYYKPDPEFGTFIDASKSYPAPKEDFEQQKRYTDVYQGIKNFLNPKASKVEESKEGFESVMQKIAPTIPLSSIEAALEAQKELAKNKPDFTVKSPERQPSGIVQPKKIDKSLMKYFSGTSAPTPESQKIVKTTPVKVPVEKSNPEKKDGGDDDVASGLKEDFTKTMNKAGDAIYNVITSPQVQGVAGGVTAGLIVSVLSMLMHEKRQETLASRRAIANRPPRPTTRAPSRPAPPPPPRGDSEFNPFANQ